MTRIEMLRDRVLDLVPEAKAEREAPPMDPQGMWWCDFHLGERWAVGIWWERRQQYGVSNNNDPESIGFGEGPNLVFDHEYVEEAAKALADILTEPI